MVITPESCNKLSDKELIDRSLENLDYFSCLYIRYETNLIRYIMRLSRLDHEDAQDILQESFIKVWKNLNAFNSDLKFSSWVYRIVHNETITHIRKKRSFGKDNTLDMEQLNEILFDDEDKVSDPEEKDLLTREMLDELPLKYKEVLFLKFYEKKSYEEISDILKIPEGTVAVRINRAKKIFKDKIERKH
jgi:RNA polymerase sigma-70 factor (ECF subfamily)